jgi:DNA helicase IV
VAASPEEIPADEVAGNGARSELAREQGYVSRLYSRLDALRSRTSAQLAEVRARGAVGTPQNRSERDSFAVLYEDRLAQLNAVENGLCFGRLDVESGERYYVGRLGLSDERSVPLLVDWRAPAAQRFYRATPARPDGVVRRRHLRSRGRTVIGVDDDVFDLTSLSDEELSTLNGEAALLASLAESRTGRMSDIVATIQAEQDRVIRSDLAGVLVVQGGPGTGKTAVALHRAAYLLYTHRERLARSGVLVVGPTPVFLRYIGQVLPSLGETGVLLATPDELLDGVEVAGPEPDEGVARLKGELRMAEVLAAAVAARQRLASADLTIPFEGAELTITRRSVSGARARARRGRRPHNEARRSFVRALVDPLVAQAIELPDGPEPGDAPYVRRALLQTEEFRDAVAEFWPRVRPEQLVRELFADPDQLRRAARGVLTDDEVALLERDPSAGWTSADVPLLDEAAELLGNVDTVARAEQERQQREAERSYAEGVLAIGSGWADSEDERSTGEGGTSDGRTSDGRTFDGWEEGPVSGSVDAELLAERFRDSGPDLTVAERAAGDREWTFGHVIVDEAQELSPMTWRVLMRRCPSRSFTLVGDVAQTGAAEGASSWASVLDPFVAGRWRAEELRVNYRTPAEIMTLAGDVLAAVDPDLTPPTSVREGGQPPRAHRAAAGELVADLPGVVQAEADAVGDGTVAVLVPGDRWPEVPAVLSEALPDLAGGTGDQLSRRVAVLPVRQAKGLEFDAVVVVDPAAVLAGSRRGANDLYVAVTRATQRLCVVYEGELPAMLHRLTAEPSDQAEPTEPAGPGGAVEPDKREQLTG